MTTITIDPVLLAKGIEEETCKHDSIFSLNPSIQKVAIYWRIICDNRHCQGHAFIAKMTFVNACARDNGVLSVRVANVVRYLSDEERLTGCHNEFDWTPFSNLSVFDFELKEGSNFYTVHGTSEEGIDFVMPNGHARLYFIEDKNQEWLSKVMW